VSRIEVQSPQGDIQEGQRLMIIKLRKYNKFGELLIGNGTKGPLGHVIYWDMVWKVSVTRPAVCMRRMGMEPQTRHGGAYNQTLG